MGGDGKVCVRNESLPYGLNHKRDLAVSCGPGMPGPYRAAGRFTAMECRGRRPRRPAEVRGEANDPGGMNPSPTDEPLTAI